MISSLSPRHRAVEFRDFLDLIDHEVDPALTVHLICDNRSTHKAPVIHRWLVAHPRFRLHFTPTYSSWINEVERWFAELQCRQLERGVFCSVDQRCQALERWITLGNTDPRPFVWTAAADRSSTRSPATADEFPSRLTSHSVLYPTTRSFTYALEQSRHGYARPE